MFGSGGLAFGGLPKVLFVLSWVWKALVKLGYLAYCAECPRFDTPLRRTAPLPSAAPCASRKTQVLYCFCSMISSMGRGIRARAGF